MPQHLYNSCSPEIATVAVNQAPGNKVPSQEFTRRLLAWIPPTPLHSLAGCNFNLLAPKCMPFLRVLTVWWLTVWELGGLWGRVPMPRLLSGRSRAEKRKKRRQFTLQLVNYCHEATRGAPSPTLQPMASSVCRRTMVATVATATTLVSSWTTGQKVSTNTEPEIRMAITISVQCNHSNGMIQKTCRGKDSNWHLCYYSTVGNSIFDLSTTRLADSLRWECRWRASNHRRTQSRERSSVQSASQPPAARSGNPINKMGPSKHTGRWLQQLLSLLEREERDSARLERTKSY